MDNIITFLTDSKDAITSFVILLTFVVSVFSLIMSVRNNKAVHYVNSITKSRIEWIQDLRDTIAEFISKTNIHNNAYYKEEYEKTGEHLSTCQKYCSKINLLLNCCDEKDKEIVEICNSILESYSNYCDEVHGCEVNSDGYFNNTPIMDLCVEEVGNRIDLLSQKVEIYLKSEWNRVKYESRGKIYEPATQEFDYNELIELYNDSTYKKKTWKRAFINFKAKIKRLLLTPKIIIFLIIAMVIAVLLILAGLTSLEEVEIALKEIEEWN